MLDRIACGSYPRKHHIAHRDAAGNLRWEECLTRQGFDGYISVDHPNHDPWEQTAEREIRYLRRLMAGELWA